MSIIIYMSYGPHDRNIMEFVGVVLLGSLFQEFCSKLRSPRIPWEDRPLGVPERLKTDLYNPSFHFRRESTQSIL